ncbi:MAG: hypothetical protein RI955_1353 [Bacteroidota bacterium]|jgi:hypothetical protein
MSKALYYVNIAAGFMYIFIAVFLAFFDTYLKPTFGTTKVYGLAFFMLAYGLFRLWRAFKTKEQ